MIFNQHISLDIPRKLWELLNPVQRRSAFVLMILMLIGMLLETVSIGMVIPLLTLMTESNLAASYPILVPWLDKLGNPSQEWLIVLAMITIVIVHVIKTGFLVFLTWQRESFTYGIEVDLSQRIFTGYLRQPYTFHLQRNSAQLIRNIIGQVGDVSRVVQKALMLIAEILVLFGISALLFTMEPLGASLVVSTLGIAGWGFHRFTRNHILRWGEARQLHEGLRIQHLQQGLGSAKDVKLLGREAEFLSQYYLHNKGSAKVGQRQSTLEGMPRLWFELLAIFGLATLVVVMIGQGRQFDMLLPTLGLFAAAAFRLMPTVSRILGSIQGVRYSLPVVHTLHSELGLLNKIEIPQKGPLLPFKSSLALEKVCFRYPSTESLALSDITLAISAGSSVGFIGGSGAGKSTLVDIILGLLTPCEGVVKVDGEDVQTNIRGWQDHIGYVPQSIYLTDDTLRRNIAFGLAIGQIDDEAVWRALSAAQLDKFVKSLPDGLDSKVGERGIRLSGGQRQRIGIARALYHDPAVLVLDEATSSLDTVTERGVMDAVRALRGDKTLIIIAHRISTIEDCDHLFRLEDGKLVGQGSYATMFGKTQLASESN